MGRGIINVSIVDDDDTTRLILKKYLVGEENYYLKLYSNGEEFLKEALNSSPDIVLLDIEMPGMTGIQIFDKMKSSGVLKNVPVIFLTGKEDRATVLKCIGRGADGYIVKPVSKKALLEKMEDVLGRYNEYKSNKTILMIDDDGEYLKISKIKLAKYFNVLTVNSGKTALDYLTAHRVDLIILDYFMPLYDGKSILNILKYRESTKDIPVIMVSSLDDEEIIQSCQGNQPDGIVGKPVDLELLLKNIRELIG